MGTTVGAEWSGETREEPIKDKGSERRVHTA